MCVRFKGKEIVYIEPPLANNILTFAVKFGSKIGTKPRLAKTSMSLSTSFSDPSLLFFGLLNFLLLMINKLPENESNNEDWTPTQ